MKNDSGPFVQLRVVFLVYVFELGRRGKNQGAQFLATAVIAQ